MRRKIAVMVCAALMTAMLGACGGSTAASSSQAEAPAETAAEEAAPAADAAKEEAAPEADAAKQEAAPEADAAAQEAAPEADAAAQEAAPEADAAAQEADASAAEVNATESTGSFASGSMFEGVITPSGETGNSDVEKLDGVGAQEALGSAPAVETLEGLSGEEASSLNGKISLQGQNQEYNGYCLGENNGIIGFAIIFENTSGVLTNYAEIYDFKKDAGYTKDDMLSFDIEKAYPGISSMSCSDWQIVDVGYSFRLMIVLKELDNPDHVQECIEKGFFTAPNYHYPQVLGASGLKKDIESKGFYKMTDDEIDKLHLVK
ncbi:MAG: hypothetical protein IJ198_01170 [Lachnospiraceae bacterium]|nr:hypothetical protein [Lachnospiraceae bacterium]